MKFIFKDTKDKWKIDPIRAYKKLKQDNYYDSVDLFLIVLQTLKGIEFIRD